MRYTKLLAVVLCCLGHIAHAAPPHPSLPAAEIPAGLGVNIHFTDAQPGELEMLTAAGFRWVRMDFHWAATEQRRGEYDFSAYERLLADLEKHGLHAMFILDYSNPLYERDASVATDSGRAAYSAWAAAATKHFQGHGILWEIWNEPNGVFWKPKEDVQQYAAMAIAASKAIRAAAPSEAIVGPATSRIDMKFLEACFQAGVLSQWDAVSVHPYRPTAPETALPEYEALRQLIAKYAPPDKSIPILSGEWGYSSGWKKFDEAQQGRLLARQWLTNLSAGIPLSIWYDWHDDGLDPNEPEHHFGTVHNKYQADSAQVYDPKAAYLAAKTLTSTLGGFHFDKRLDLPSPEDYALQFRSGDELRLAVWTTSPTPHLAKLPVTPGRYEAISHLGDSRKQVTATAGVFEFDINESPLYLLAAP